MGSETKVKPCEKPTGRCLTPMACGTECLHAIRSTPTPSQGRETKRDEVREALVPILARSTDEDLDALHEALGFGERHFGIEGIADALLSRAQPERRTETYPHDCGCETCPDHTRADPTPTADGAEAELMGAINRTAHRAKMFGIEAVADVEAIRAHTYAVLRARPLPADVQAVVELVDSDVEWFARRGARDIEPSRVDVSRADLRTLLAHLQRGTQ